MKVININLISGFPDMGIDSIRPLTRREGLDFIRTEKEKGFEWPIGRLPPKWACWMSRKKSCESCGASSRNAPFIAWAGDTPEAALSVCLERLQAPTVLDYFRERPENADVKT
jgi:hypothetical protein